MADQETRDRIAQDDMETTGIGARTRNVIRAAEEGRITGDADRSIRNMVRIIRYAVDALQRTDLLPIDAAVNRVRVMDALAASIGETRYERLDDPFESIRDGREGDPLIDLLNGDL